MSQGLVITISLSCRSDFTMCDDGFTTAGAASTRPLGSRRAVAVSLQPSARSCNRLRRTTSSGRRRRCVQFVRWPPAACRTGCSTENHAPTEGNSLKPLRHSAQRAMMQLASGRQIDLAHAYSQADAMFIGNTRENGQQGSSSCHRLHRIVFRRPRNRCVRQNRDLPATTA
jgi:hypothetical protein